MKHHTKVHITAGRMPFPWDGSSMLSPALIILSILLMGVSAFKPHSFDFFRSKISDLFSPALTLVSLPFQNASVFLHDVMGLAQLQADNLRLEQENIKLREWYQVALLLESENKSLRDLLNLKVEPHYEHISARIIADAGNKYVKSWLVSVGRNDGISKGDAVLSGDGLVGRIVEVGEKTSRILLVTDINSRVPVVVEDTGQHAIMAGTNGHEPTLIHLPQESEIFEKARLITSGYGEIYPHGLPIGEVVLHPDKTMGVALFVNFDRIQIVRVVQKNNVLEQDK